MSGKLTENGVRLYAHERLTVEYFLERGEDVELMVPSNRVGGKNADLKIWNKIWEMKSPTSTNKNTITVMMKRAVKQSQNLIIDLRRLKGNDSDVIKVLRTRFLVSRRLRSLLIIMKNGDLIGFGDIAKTVLV